MNVESPLRTLLIALGIAFVCSALVTSAVHFLRPLQSAYAQLERNRAVVEAAGQLPVGESSAFEILALYRELNANVLDLTTGAVDNDVNIIGANNGTTPAHGEKNSTKGIVYLSHRDTKLERAILPVQITGMWSTIDAYVGINIADLSIADVVFYRHGETPGIGDRIQQLDWREQWQGKRIYNEAMEAIFSVVKNASGAHEVDAISGATITSMATGRFVRSAMEQPGYKAFLQRRQLQAAQ